MVLTPLSSLQGLLLDLDLARGPLPVLLTPLRLTSGRAALVRSPVLWGFQAGKWWRLLRRTPCCRDRSTINVSRLRARRALRAEFS